MDDNSCVGGCLKEIALIAMACLLVLCFGSAIDAGIPLFRIIFLTIIGIIIVGVPLIAIYCRKEGKYKEEIKNLLKSYPIGFKIWLDGMNNYPPKLFDCLFGSKYALDYNDEYTNEKVLNDINSLSFIKLRKIYKSRKKIIFLDYKSKEHYKSIHEEYPNGTKDIANATPSFILFALDPSNKGVLVKAEKENKIYKLYNEIVSKYPLGVSLWLYHAGAIENIDKFYIYSIGLNLKEKVVRISNTSDFGRIEIAGDKEYDILLQNYPLGLTKSNNWHEKLKAIVTTEDIKHKHYSKVLSIEDQDNKRWIFNQSFFNAKCLKNEESLEQFGRSEYEVSYLVYYGKRLDRSDIFYLDDDKMPVKLKDKNGQPIKSNIKILQYFAETYSKKSRLPKKYFDNSFYKDLPKFQSGKKYFKKWVYEDIKNFIYSIKKDIKDLSIVFNLKDKGWNTEVLKEHFLPLKEMCGSINDDIHFYVRPQYIDGSYHILVIDFNTENDDLINYCSEIIKAYEESGAYKRPCIVYLSMLKCYDDTEIDRIISEAKEKEEKERIEEEHKKEIQKSLPYKVYSWKALPNGFRFNYLFEYYPTTCMFEADKQMWNNRYLVWNFKNNPEKVTEEEHQDALNEIVARVKSLLEDTFNKDNLRYLTLVCITAATRERTERRYKEFSEKLCYLTGMINAYSHIHVVKDSVPKVQGGSGLPTIEFEENYFKDKYVILFDDVITKGNSMTRYDSILKSLGAHVVGGISIGRTRHEIVSPLVHMAVKFFIELNKATEKLKNGEGTNNTEAIKACLGGIRFPKDSYIRLVKFPGFDYELPGAECHLYIILQNGKKQEDLSNCEIYPKPFSVWQVYLYHMAYTVMPLYDHSAYIHRKFIFDKDDLHSISVFDGKRLPSTLEKINYQPQVTIANYSAIVSCYYWNNWKGLVLEKAEVKLGFSKTIGFFEDSYKITERKIIYPYDCGMMI